jgi:hypothetical protein
MKLRTTVPSFITLILISLTLSVCACAQKTAVNSTTTSFAPVVKNDSIVTAKILSVQDGDGDLPWVLTIQIRTSQDVSGYPNYTASKIGQTVIVRCTEDASHLQTGEIITAHLRFEGDETRSFYFIWNIR